MLQHRTCRCESTAEANRPYQYSIPRGRRRIFMLPSAAALAGLLLALGSCRPAPPSPSAIASPTEVPIPFQASSPPSAAIARVAQQVQTQLYRWTPPANAVEVTVYHLDQQCQDFVPQTVPVAADKPISDAIGHILQDQHNRAFILSGYRVELDRATGQLTVDLRLAPDSPRLLVSLSSCEQLALFGSIRKTVLENPDWGVQTVTFRDRGQDLTL